MGVYKTPAALQLAEELELDLVEISPNAEPPVCKIMDYKKFLYEQKKRDKELKAKSAQITVKEIRFGPQTDEHDYEFKKKNAEKFLKEGSKLKAFVFFKGRSIDRKSTRLNSSHVRISYAVFCLKKKKKNGHNYTCRAVS